MSDKLLSEHLLFILKSRHTLCKLESSSELLVLQSFCWHHFLIFFFFLVNTTFLIYVYYLPSLSFYTCTVRVFCIGIINRHYNHHKLFLLKLHLCSALFSFQHYFLSFLSIFLSSFLTSFSYPFL